MITKTSSLNSDFEFIEKLAVLMDSKFTIPGTKFRFGLDPILNLIPFLGEAVSFAISGALVAIMAKHGASGKTVVKMILNIIVDLIIGGIPLVGKVGDFFFKANKKNLALLKGHYFEGKHQGSGWGIIITIVVILFIIFTLIIYMMYKLAAWLVDLLNISEIFQLF